MDGYCWTTELSKIRVRGTDSRVILSNQESVFTQSIVNWVEWLWNPSDSFVICFCGPESAQRSKEFANRKQRIVHFQGASNIKCSTVVFIIDVCRFL